MYIKSAYRADCRAPQCRHSLHAGEVSFLGRQSPGRAGTAQPSLLPHEESDDRVETEFLSRGSPPWSLPRFQVGACLDLEAPDLPVLLRQREGDICQRVWRDEAIGGPVPKHAAGGEPVRCRDLRLRPPQWVGFDRRSWPCAAPCQWLSVRITPLFAATSVSEAAISRSRLGLSSQSEGRIARPLSSNIRPDWPESSGAAKSGRMRAA